MSDFFLEFDAQASPSFITSIASHSFDETVYDEIVVESVDADSNSMGEAIVTGYLSSGLGLWFSFANESNDYEPHPTLYTGPGGGPSPTYWDLLQWACLADATTDDVARQIEALIKAQPDWNAREYGAYIYMVGNEIKMSELFRGTTVAEALAEGKSAAYTRFGTPPDLGDGVILAAVHSHPDFGYTALEDLENHYPSDPGGDYSALQKLGESAARFGNNVSFAQYIVGPDGILREFNFADGRITRANDANPSSRSDLAKDRQCAS